jgi:excisionase family DNA binding protein
MTTAPNTSTRRALSLLAEAADAASSAAATVRVSIGETTADLPVAVVAQIAELLGDISGGREVTVAPYDLAIGTERAAELLGVSRPWLTALLDRGDIPMVRNGTKRRVRLGDLIVYRRAEDRRRRGTQTWERLDGQPVAEVRVLEPRSTTRSRSSTPPADWSHETGPGDAVVELPFHLYWSDDNNRFDLSKRARLRSMYQIVLTEGSDEDVRTYINRALLDDVWDELWLSPAVHEAWDSWIEAHRHATV